MCSDLSTPTPFDDIVERTSSFTLYSHLPVELQREITILAVQDAIARFVDDIKHKRTTRTLSNLIYDFAVVLDRDVIRHLMLSNVAMKSDIMLASFLYEVTDKPGIASAVTALTIDGSTLIQPLAWDSFVQAKQCMNRLTQMTLVNVRVAPPNIKGIVAGIQHLSLIRCHISFINLNEAFGGLTSFIGRSNTIYEVETYSGKPFLSGFTKVEFDATTSEEREAYCSLLARLPSVSQLDLRGIGKGWDGGDGWKYIVSLTCLHALSRQAARLPNVKDLFLAITLDDIPNLIRFISPQTVADIMVTIDVPTGFLRDERLHQLWHALDRCENAKSIAVVFYVVDREYEKKIKRRLMRSNKVGQLDLCARALIRVMPVTADEFYQGDV
ncbi:hypothetical protein CYLTODRAFT_466542 [Cylindrobasidium torrendii FP15055 ss-10]|uniref:F-box domain-containing protein n=1 Tax=Cylindrobasidium torrendii FP15055 ss-10 TaxID=1314674 RepID=A0A0D7B3C1_9AGAR|nr:hypothetical protein CYLTODRAFT_466542 [Cylindrobasidium torrendii FP15055 ss-10]